MEMVGRVITVHQGDCLHPGYRVEVVVRPETVEIVSQGKRDFNGVVEFSQYTGSIPTYRLEFESREEMDAKVLNPIEKGS